MRFVHLSDLHLGKIVNGFSMLESQKLVLKDIISIVKSEKVDAVLIAGDIFDKPIPPVEAVKLFDEFITEITLKKITVLAISGNHDSADRVSVFSKILSSSGYYISNAYEGKSEPIVLEDSFGKINFWLLPFIKPSVVRPFFEGETIDSYDDALKMCISKMNIDKSERNVIISHQFVTGSSTCDSEEFSIGGSENVSSENYEIFDYAALGHIHGPQKIGKDYIRYSGTPLKYSFSEVNHKKSVSVVTMGKKGEVDVKLVPLKPAVDFREIKGSYDELMDKNNYEKTNTKDYLHITLTDEEDIYDAIGKLRSVYPNIMKLDFENSRSNANQNIEFCSSQLKLNPFTLFEQFFKNRNNVSMNENQSKYMENLFSDLGDK